MHIFYNENSTRLSNSERTLLCVFRIARGVRPRNTPSDTGT